MCRCKSHMCRQANPIRRSRVQANDRLRASHLAYVTVVGSKDRRADLASVESRASTTCSTMASSARPVARRPRTSLRSHERSLGQRCHSVTPPRWARLSRHTAEDRRLPRRHRILVVRRSFGEWMTGADPRRGRVADRRKAAQWRKAPPDPPDPPDPRWAQDSSGTRQSRPPSSCWPSSDSAPAAKSPR
jgi:hypothetical protein